MRSALLPHETLKTLLGKSVRYLHGIGFREVCVTPASCEDWGKKDTEELERQVANIADYVLECHRQGEDFNVIAFKYYLGHLVHFRETGQVERIARKCSSCGAGKGYLMIDAVGDIWPCHRFEGADRETGASAGFRMGNIFKPGFNNQLQAAFLDFDHLGRSPKAMCGECGIEPTCGGHCPAANVSNSGSIYIPHDVECMWSQLVYDTATRIYRRTKEFPGAFKKMMDSAWAQYGDGWEL